MVKNLLKICLWFLLAMQLLLGVTSCGSKGSSSDKGTVVIVGEGS